MLPSLLSSKGERSTSKKGAGNSVNPRNLKVAQLVPRFLLHDNHMQTSKGHQKTFSEKVENETLSKRLAQKNGKHFTSRHTRNSIDVNGQHDPARQSMAPKDHQMRASGSQVVNPMYTT